MAYYASYRDDPRWLRARYAGSCAGKDCGEKFGKGADIFWYPKGKHAFYGACAERAAADFRACAEDEYMMSGRFGY